MALTVFFGGCADSGVTSGVTDSGAPDTVVVDSVQTDTSVPDIVVPDTNESDLTSEDAGQSSTCEPGEGCFGEPCEGNENCLSGICTQHMGEKVCSKTCDEACPQGWDCALVGGGGDGQYVCTSKFSHLCLPCETSEGCTGDSPNACVKYADGTSFCGGACDVDTPCPSGYACQEVETANGATSFQCVNTAGVCPCTNLAIESALSTPCETTNELGTCGGVRICEESGLSACSALEATEEICNGIDDDCNGVADDGTCDDGNGCTIDTCEGESGCKHEAIDGGECLDGDACTIGDHCEEGVCVGKAIDCDDENPCTKDSCDGLGGCKSEPQVAVCDDGDPCTLGDLCTEGVCQGTATLTCDDGNPCTDDSCGEAGCVYTANEGGCDDGNACTEGDACADGACVGAMVACDDGNLCTTDSCDVAKGCVTANNTQPCDDGDTCTLGDICADGGCVAGGEALACQDGNPCTDDGCDAGLGCIFTANQVDCDDKNACTTSDVCAEGACLGSGSLACDDGNPCTIDSCLPGGGCSYENAVGICNDGDACTVNDTCQEGQCVSGSVLSCDDGNPCTDEVCEGGDCIFTPNQSDCDDGNTCTVSDVCKAGACMGSSALVCDDGNVCTVDSCLPETGCAYANAVGSCDDGNACTVNDICVDGDCESGLLLTCDDDNPCTDQVCEGGDCIFTPNSNDCDDGNACTQGDVCKGGWCSFTASLDCSDDNPCTDDACDVETGCSSVPNTDPCNDGDLCTLGDTCSDGSCVAGGESLVCDDGLYCNGQESCSPEKGCVSGEAPTDDDGFECTQEVCDEETDAIVSVPNDNLCDPAPGMLCKVGVCNVESGCGVADKPNCCGNSIVENGETCDDGNNVGDDGCSAQCEKEGTFVSLVGEPEVAAVFSDIERTFCYSNNLMNGLWVMPGDKIVTGHYSQAGYYIHSSNQGGHPQYPDVDTGNIYRRMVHMPAFSRVAITLNQQYPTGAGEIMLATIDGETGIISDRVMAQFSDGFSEKCNLISSDTEHFLCMTEGAIRWYKASESSSTLEYVKTVGLDAANYAQCSSHCFGGTFAWDGKYYYVAQTGNGSGNSNYVVFDADGNYVGAYGGGIANITSVYFDWHVGRYTVHDGYGDRQAGAVYSWQGGQCGDDTQTYGPPSLYHQ